MVLLQFFNHIRMSLTQAFVHALFIRDFLFRKYKEEYKIEQYSNTTQQDSHKPRNTHHFSIQTKKIGNSGTNPANNTVISRTTQSSHFLSNYFFVI